MKQSVASIILIFILSFVLNLMGIEATNYAVSTTPLTTATPTPDMPEAQRVALEGVTSNAEWENLVSEEGYVREFNGVEMVLVPAGGFEMGSTAEEMAIAVQLCNDDRPDGETCPASFFADEAPNGDNGQRFDAPFWIDKTEVSRAQYEACVDDGVCSETPNSDYSSEPNQPINRVNWFEANDYCKWQYGDDMGRLPTEAEWEYAARGVDRLIFPWGNEFSGTFANHCDSNCGDADWASDRDYVNEENDDGYAMTAPVGSYPQGASWVGALDMSGNVSEWAFSEYRDYPYDADDGRNDDYLDSNGHYRVDDRRVLRGGGIRSNSSSLRAAGRGSGNPWYGDDFRGFRCVRSYN